MDIDGDRDDLGRFKAGHKGGPGRPVFSIVSKIKAKLQNVPEGQHEALVDTLIDEYIENTRHPRIGGPDGVAMRDIIDRFDGKAQQKVRVEGVLDGAWGEYLNHEAGAERQAVSDTEALQPGTAEATDT